MPSPVIRSAVIKVTLNSPYLLAELPVSATVGLSNGCSALYDIVTAAVSKAKDIYGISPDPARFSVPSPPQGSLPFATWCSAACPAHLSLSLIHI